MGRSLKARRIKEATLSPFPALLQEDEVFRATLPLGGVPDASPLGEGSIFFPIKQGNIRRIGVQRETK